MWTALITWEVNVDSLVVTSDNVDVKKNRVQSNNNNSMHLQKSSFNCCLTKVVLAEPNYIRIQIKSHYQRWLSRLWCTNFLIKRIRYSQKTPDQERWHFVRSTLVCTVKTSSDKPFSLSYRTRKGIGSSFLKAKAISGQCFSKMLIISITSVKIFCHRAK